MMGWVQEEKWTDGGLGSELGILAPTLCPRPLFVFGVEQDGDFAVLLDGDGEVGSDGRVDLWRRLGHG